MRDITLEETIYINFTTRSFTTGVPTVLGGTPALSVIESNNVTPITAGVSLQTDRASVVGLNQATIVATAANGYEAGKSYSVYISTGTVGGVSVVGEVVGQFTVQAAAAYTTGVAIKTKTDFLPSATAGAAGGVFIAGSNAATSVTTAFTANITGNLSGSVGSVTGAVGSVTSGVTVTTNNDKTGYSLTATTGLGNQTANITGTITTATNVTTVNGLAANVITDAAIAADVTAVIADAVWNAATATYGAAGSYGLLAETNLDAAITTRMATYAQPTGFLAATFPGTVASTTNITAATGVTVSTNSDKTGYSLTATTGLGNQTSNITGNLSGSVASVTAAVAITSNIKQNQALAGFAFLMTDSTSHNPATGLTVTVTRSINGAAFAAGTLSAVTEVGNGVYSVDFGAGDLNGKTIILQATAAASDTTFERILTQV